jgi:hypothetical protein
MAVMAATSTLLLMLLVIVRGANLPALTGVWQVTGGIVRRRGPPISVTGRLALLGVQRR